MYIHVRRRNPRHRFTEDLVRVLLRRLLSAFDYLHKDAHLIHTGKVLAPNLMQKNRGLTGHKTSSVPGIFF